MSLHTWVKGNGRKVLWYASRLAILLVIAGLVWFFFFRPASQESNTSAPSTSNGSEKVTMSPPKEGSKAQDQGASKKGTANSSGSAASNEDLPGAGPADTAAIFLGATLAGVFIWELRLRKARR